MPFWIHVMHQRAERNRLEISISREYGINYSQYAREKLAVFKQLFLYEGVNIYS